jgi:transposase
LADIRRGAVRSVVARVAQVIRIDEAWLAVDPLNMRAGSDTVLARVVAVFDAAHPHHAYLFTNRRASRLKVLVHDGIGIRLAARRLNQGQFVWPQPGTHTRRAITQENWLDWCSDCRGNASAKTA